MYLYIQVNLEREYGSQQKQGQQIAIIYQSATCYSMCLAQTDTSSWVASYLHTQLHSLAHLLDLIPTLATYCIAYIIMPTKVAIKCCKDCVSLVVCVGN